MTKLTGREIITGIINADMVVINAYMRNLYAGKISGVMADKIINAAVDQYTGYDLDHPEMSDLIAGLAIYDDYDYSSSEFVIGHILTKKKED